MLVELSGPTGPYVDLKLGLVMIGDFPVSFSVGLAVDNLTPFSWGVLLLC